MLSAELSLNGPLRTPQRRRPRRRPNARSRFALGGLLVLGTLCVAERWGSVSTRGAKL